MSFFESRFRQANRQKQQETYFKELGDWVTELIQLYFEPLIDAQIEAYGGTKNLAFQDYLNLFSINLFGEADSAKLPAFLEQERERSLAGVRRNEFKQALQINFLGHSGISGDQSDKKEMTKTIIDSARQQRASLGKEIPAKIVIALQAVIFSLPVQFFTVNEEVPGSVESEMVDALRNIEEKLRRPMQLEDEQFDLDKQLARMIYENGKATGFEKLPLISLINAPLSEEDIKNRLYARQDDEQEARLARQILRGTGAILIAGYRGVGKSTFVNKVLYELEETFVPMQVTHPKWYVVPVRISLAKATNVSTVLRYCIRTLYNLFLYDEQLAVLLRPEEIQLLQLAYLRATYRFAQEHSESSSNAIETQTSLKITLGDFIGSIIPMPSVEGNISRAWNKKIDQTVGLLDYDEDQAEEDIRLFIERLSKERSPSKLKEQQLPLSKMKRYFRGKPPENNLNTLRRADSIRIKLVFVFDEMDKMDEDEGQMPLVRQLKNLFLSRHAVFLLLTSKKFYYKWLTERRQEDSVLNSYFTSVSMVPMFTTEDTLQLLRNISKVSLGNDNDPLFLRTFAQYLNYRAMGVPREILRELHDMQQWIDNTLQPYLTDRTDQFGIISLYAKIQDVLEELDDQSSNEPKLAIGQITTFESNSEGETEEVEIIEEGVILGIGERSKSIIAEASGAPERFWLNDGLREQIRRGRYVLVEQLLTDGYLEWSESLLQDEDSTLHRIYKDNFGLISTRDFLDKIKEVATRLPSVFIKTSDYSILTTDEETPELIAVFRRTNVDGSSSMQNRLDVDKRFYTITGLSPNQPDNSSIVKNNNRSEPLSDKMIEEYLSSTILTKKQQALDYLTSQTIRPEKQTIRENLYLIFTSSETEMVLRIGAGNLLDGKQFLQMSKETNFEQSLSSEQNGIILERVVALTQEGALDIETKRTGYNLLSTLIKRGENPKASSPNASGKLYTSLYIDAVTAMVKIGATKESMALVAKGVEKGSKLPSSLFSLLTALQQNSPDSLLELLVTQDIRGLEESKIRELISQEKNLSELWTRLLPQKYNTLAQQVLSEILVWQAQNPNQQTTSTLIIDWLNGSSWLSIDRKILDQAATKPRVPAYITQLVEQSDNNIRAKGRVAYLNPPSLPQQVQEDKEQSSPPASSPVSRPLSPEEKGKKQRNRILGTVGFLSIYAFFILVPINLPTDVTIASRVIGRLLEFAYLPLIILGIGLLIIAIFEGRLVTGINGLVCLFLAGLCFFGLIVILQHPLTLGGQILLALINIIGWSLLIFSLIQDDSTSSQS